MMLITTGNSFIELAKMLYTHKMETVSCEQVYDNPEYKRFNHQRQALINEINQALPEDLQNKLKILSEDIDNEMNSTWESYQFERGFLDGIHAMAAIICKLNNKPVRSLIVDLLNEDYVLSHMDEGSIDTVKEFTAEVKNLITEILVLEEFDVKLLANSRKMMKLSVYSGEGQFLFEISLSECQGVQMPTNGKNGYAKLPDGQYVLIRKCDGEYHGIIHTSGEIARSVLLENEAAVFDDEVYPELNQLLNVTMSVREFILNSLPDCEDLLITA